MIACKSKQKSQISQGKQGKVFNLYGKPCKGEIA